MLSTVLLIGTALGAGLGVLHAGGIYRDRLNSITRRGGASTSARIQATYAAVWSFVLWTAFGSYVLIIWLVSLPIWVGSRALRGA